ncbi:hypothetical protein [Streptomyces mirabilis]|uniref:hypothetical protein n=1 Tax=Streptomyces mirabilis TaxID=68239 RepID=UPI003646EB4A
MILVPIGAIARIQALARRLLWHLSQDEPTVAVTASALDESDTPWDLAPDLAPIFGEGHAQEDTRYWEALKAFNMRTPPDDWRDILVSEFIWISFLHLFLHELVHIAAHHDRLLALARTKDPLIPQHLNLSRLRRGMEVQADVVAAENLARFLVLDPAANHQTSEAPEALFHKVSFALSALFGMYDIHRKTVYEYDAGSYPHPIIRYEFVDEAFQTVMRDARPDLVNIAQEHGMNGFVQCAHAFSALELHCMLGMYGRPSPGAQYGTERYVPITTLKYSEAPALRPRMIQDNRLFLEVADLSLQIAFGRN